MKRNGFTLIEVILVIGIISLMVIVGIWASRLQFLKGKDGQKKADIHNIQIAVEDYEKDNECYPVSLPSCTDSDSFRPYISHLPCNRSTGANYYYVADPTTACPKWYWIFTDLENNNDSDIEKLGCSGGCGPTASQADFDYYAASPNAPLPYLSGGDGSGLPDGNLEVRYGCNGTVCVPIEYNPSQGMSCSPNYTEIFLDYCNEHCNSETVCQ